LTLVTAGRVGRPHGRDGSFYLDRAAHPLPVDTPVVLRGAEHRVLRRAGTDERPLVRLSRIEGPEAVAALRGEPLLVEGELADGEWLARDLVGCAVGDLGEVRRVLAGPSCDLLELDDGTLVPLVRDAIRSVDPAAGRIDVDPRFLGLE
jgi:16S rRNA processing protein RimM